MACYLQSEPAGNAGARGISAFAFRLSTVRLLESRRQAREQLMRGYE